MEEHFHFMEEDYDLREPEYLEELDSCDFPLPVADPPELPLDLPEAWTPPIEEGMTE